VSIEPATGLLILNIIIILSGIALTALAGVFYAQGYGTAIIGMAIFIGVVMIILAGVAIYGLKINSKSILYTYFVILLIIVLMLIFSMIASFIFSDRLQSFFDANWQTIANNYPTKLTKDQVYSLIKENALILGGVCLVITLLLIFTLVVTSMVIGTQKALSKLMKGMNILAGLLGAAIITIGIGMSIINIGQAWMVTLCYLVGSFILITSLFGYCGVYRESIMLLKVYFTLVMVLAILLLFFGIYVTNQQQQLMNYFNQNFDCCISQNLPQGYTKEYFLQFMDENLTLIGALSIAGFLFMVFCMIVTTVLIRNTNPFEKMGDDDDDIEIAPKKSHKILK